jgi:hypothetical protein
MKSLIKHQLIIGDPQDPWVFTLQETPERLEGWVDTSSTVFLVSVETMNDLDFNDPVVHFKQEFEHYSTALVVFSTQLQLHAKFNASYQKEALA